MTEVQVQASETHDANPAQLRKAHMTRQAARSRSVVAVTKTSRRDRLIDEAARQFNTNGVTDSSLRDVAASLGISRAALYYYIEDREDLVFQVYRRTCELLARHLGESIAAGGTTLDILTGFMGRSLAPDAPQIVALNEMGLLRDPERETIEALHEGLASRLTGLLEAACRSGEIRSCDCPIVARTILSLILGSAVMISWPMDGVGQPDLDRQCFADILTDLLINGWMQDRGMVINPPVIDLAPLKPRTVAGFDREGLAKARREQILLTASRLFNQKGVDGTSLDEIASALSATKRTLYQYVGDKQAIVSACFQRNTELGKYLNDQFAAQRAAGVSAISAAVSAQRAGALVTMTKDIELLRLTSSFMSHTEPDRAALKAYGAEMFLSYRRVYQSLHQRGIVRDVDLTYLLMQIVLAPNWLARAVIPQDTDHMLAVAAEVHDVLRLGLKPL